MIFLKRYFSIFVIILSVLAVYTKDSDISLIKSSHLLQKSDSNPTRNVSNFKGSDVKSKSPYESIPYETMPRNVRAGVGAGGSLFREFWHSLYVDRTAFNSSFALNVPLFTITVPGYGRGLKYETPLSALNVGNVSSLLITSKNNFFNGCGSAVQAI